MRLPGGFDVALPRILLVCLVAALLGSVFVAGATSGTAFGAYNTGWNGGHEYRALASDHARTVVATSTKAYGSADPGSTTAVVLSPGHYSARGLARVRRFVAHGGTLVVAADVGPHRNSLLAGLGVPIRFDGHLVRDDQHYYRSPALPIATSVRDGPLTGNASSVTLNYATVLTGTANATVLVRTSGYAYVDRNGNGRLDANESLGAHPVAAVTSVGKGRVVAVSDPSVFIDRMLQRPGDRAFATGLVSGSGTVLFDYSHAPSVPPLRAAALSLNAHPLAAFGLLALVVLGFAAWSTGWTDGPLERIRSWRDDGPSGERVALTLTDVERVVEREHPDWPPERVHRVAARIRATRADDARDGNSKEGYGGVDDVSTDD